MTPLTRPTSRRSEASGIASRPDIFSRPSFREKIFYVLLRVAFLAAFSLVLYVWIVRDMHRGVAAEISDPAAQARFVDRATRGLKIKLIIVDSSMILVAGFFGYMLSGKRVRPIQKALEAQINFSSQASHELRTPLTVIKTENELALRDTGATVEELRSVMRSTVVDVGRMTAIVSDLLALSRGEEAAKDPSTQSLDLATAAARICKRMRPLAEAKGVAFVCEAGPAAFARIDESGMEKVQTNLIQNAINYTPRGGNVSVSVERLHGRLALIVRDTGVGISTEDLPHVFEPFYKGRHEGDGYTQGTGLGLTIVKRTVGDFGGKILVESQVGEGTTMTVLLKERQSG